MRTAASAQKSARLEGICLETDLESGERSSMDTTENQVKDMCTCAPTCSDTMTVDGAARRHVTSASGDSFRGKRGGNPGRDRKAGDTPTQTEG